MTMIKNSRQNQGFTLIELLVVIAIIAILAAILFPVFATAREKARLTSCSSNQKQLALAFLQYVQDYDETLPMGPSGYAGQPGRGWAGNVYPYVKSTNVYICPDDTTVAATGSIPYSYAQNVNFYLARGYSVRTSALTMAQMASVPSTVLFYEVIGCQGGINHLIGTPGWSAEFDSPAGTGQIGLGEWELQATPAPSPTAAQATARHSGGSNYAALDGHVKWLMPDKVSTGDYSDSGAPPNHVPVTTSNLGTNTLTFNWN